MYTIQTTDSNNQTILHKYATREQFDTAYWNFVKDKSIRLVEVI